jgi:DNA-binding response OmpR family regulator
LIGSDVCLTTGSAAGEARTWLNSTGSISVAAAVAFTVQLELDLPTDEALTLIRDLKRDRALKSMQVLALTRRSSPWDKLRAGWCGVDAYLVKPVSMQVLQETVGRSMQRALNHALKAQAGSTQQGGAAGASA